MCVILATVGIDVRLTDILPVEVPTNDKPVVMELRCRMGLAPRNDPIDDNIAPVLIGPDNAPRPDAGGVTYLAVLELHVPALGTAPVRTHATCWQAHGPVRAAEPHPFLQVKVLRHELAHLPAGGRSLLDPGSVARVIGPRRGVGYIERVGPPLAELRTADVFDTAFHNQPIATPRIEALAPV